MKLNSNIITIIFLIFNISCNSKGETEICIPMQKTTIKIKMPYSEIKSVKGELEES